MSRTQEPSKKSIEKKYRNNFFKSGDMDALYKYFPDPWRLKVDGHDRYLRILTEIDRQFPNGNPKFILDVGCGEGVLTKMMARRYCGATLIVGFDISPTAISRASHKASARENYYTLDLGKDEIKMSNNFDVIVLGDILYYLNDQKEIEHALSELERCAGPGCIVILTEFLRTRKYSNLIAEKFERIVDTRETVRYKERPIDGVKDSTLTYRFIVFRRRDGHENSVGS